MDGEVRLGKHFTLCGADAIMFCTVMVMAIVARIWLLPYASRDYNVFLQPWYNELASMPGFTGFGASIGDYTPAYIYIMTLLTKIPMDSLYSIKLVSIAFDMVAAVVVMLTVAQTGYTKNRSLAAMTAYTAFLLGPTVCLNSALWAQCDVIFTLFLLLCIYCFTRKRPMAACVMFGIAFAFKLQAIFLAPLLIVIWIRGRVKFRHLLMIPAVYIISILPAWLMGRPFFELLTIYFRQAGQYTGLSLNAPNLYTWIDGDIGADISRFGIIVAGIGVLLILYWCVRERPAITKRSIIAFAMLFAVGMPFLLPHMHERYYYLADVVSILYAFTFRRRGIVPVVVILCSLAAYSPYLFAKTPIDLGLAALGILAVVIIVCRDIFVKGTTREKAGGGDV